MKQLLTVIISLGLAVGFTLIETSPTQARGSLVKGSSAAVYYVGSDGNRYVFPNEKIYFSWYPDFSTVTTIADEALAEYPIGGNITYRPGTRLIKLTSSPKVYAVEPGGILRWIGSESVAKDLFGTDWASRVDDLPDGFWPAYTVGSELEDAIYPTGSLVIDNNQYYLIWNGQKRELNETGYTNNGYQAIHALSGDLSDYPTGTTVTGEDETFSDTAQLDYGQNQAYAIVATAEDNTTTATQGSDDQLFGVFTFSLAETTEIEELVIRIKADTSSDSDSDAGGLIRGDNEELIEANLTNIRLESTTGEQLHSALSLIVEESQDGSQDLTAALRREFSPGQHTFYLYADVDGDTPKSEQYTAYILINESEFLINNTETTDYNTTTLTAQSVTIVTKDVELSLASGYTEKTIIAGSEDEIDLVAFSFKNDRDEAVYLKELKLTGYIDEGEDSDDFVSGIDSDVGNAGTYFSDVIDSVTLINDEDDTLVKTQTTIQSNGKVDFLNLSLEIPANDTLTVLAQVSVNSNAPYGTRPDRVSLDVADSEDDVMIRTSQDLDVDLDGSLPNGGAAPTAYLTVSDGGSLTIEGSGASHPRLVMASEDKIVYMFTFAASEEENMIVDRLTLLMMDISSQRSVEQVQLRWVGESGYEYAQTGVSNGNADFEDLEIVVPADDELDLEVMVNVRSSTTGAVSGDEIGFNFEPNTFLVHGESSGVEYDYSDFGQFITDETTTGYNSTVRKNQPILALSEDQPSQDQDRSSETEMFYFTISKEGEGSPEISKMTFMIEPSDVGYELNDVTSDNDLLEELADVNGDSSDDDEVISLIDLDTYDEVGDGSSGHIDFYIYDSSEKILDETPAGLDTANNDYGIVVVEFTSPLTAYSYGKEYLFRLNTAGLATGNQNIEVTVLSGDDFIWGDGTLTGDEENGDGVSGLKLNLPTISFQ